MERNVIEELELAEQGVSFRSFILVALALFVGTFAAANLLPAWLPDLASSMLGSNAKVFWFLSRATALVSFGLLWLSMAFGLLITNHMARTWPGGPTAVGVHEYTSLIGLGFGFFHGLILMGDRYINYDLFQVMVPFASANYRPLWVGLGQVAFYLWVVLVLSFYVRKRIGTKTWRLIHYVSFLTLTMVIVHGVTSGTDTKTAWAAWMYWAAGGSLLFLTFYRILFNIKLSTQAKSKPAKIAQRPRPNLQS